ncbi:phage portal protein [Sphingomonas mesophila]|uniref:phage portal protein n=1 Tax=Sphingomonas mesophila TaxID=2303576 RepID=UPI000E569C0B|nr:phage portal protein [Sphingomonas mesophila]
MFNWFGRKSVPVDGAHLPPWLRQPRDEGFARGYAEQVREVYRTNPVGLRCVRLIAGAVGGLTIFSNDDAVAALVSGALRERLAAALLLHGNAYVQLIADDQDRPRELVDLRPDRCSVAGDARGQPCAIVYRGGGGGRDERIALKDALYRRQAVHVRALDPADDHYGLGCLEAAIGAATVHNRASRWNKALLDNAARPSGALSYSSDDRSEMTGAQFERLKRELEEQFQGAMNAGRPLLLEGGLKWQAISLTPAEMDFVALKESAARDIALAFGVPPVLVGLPGDATYANAREAGRALYRQTVLPLAGQILDALSGMLGYRVGRAERADGLRQLRELELVEVSLVAQPMQKLARVHRVEGAVTARDKAG